MRILIIFLFFCNFTFSQSIDTLSRDIYENSKIVQKDFYKNGKVDITIKYFYDSSGNLIRRVWINKKGNIIAVIFD